MAHEFDSHGISGTYYTDEGYSNFGGVKTKETFYNVKLHTPNTLDVYHLIKSDGVWNHSEFKADQMAIVTAIAAAIDELEGK